MKSFEELVQEARAKVAAMSELERAAMWQAQRESWQNGEQELAKAAKKWLIRGGEKPGEIYTAPFIQTIPLTDEERDALARGETIYFNTTTGERC